MTSQHGGEEMADNHILDLKQKLIAMRVKEGASYIFCPVCESDDSGFAVQGRFNHHGAYYVESLICISEQCGGKTSIDIIGGFVAT